MAHSRENGSELPSGYLGYADQDDLPQHVKGLYTDHREPHRIGQGMTASSEGTLSHHTTFLRGKVDQRIPVRLSATLLYDAEQQNVVGSVGYFEDLRTLREAERQRELLLSAIKAVIHPDDPIRGLQQLTELIAKLLQRSFCRILLMDESAKALTVKAAAAIRFRGQNLNWNESLNKQALLADWPGMEKLLNAGIPTVLRLNDARYRSALQRFSQELELGAQEIQELLMVPLKWGDDVVGLLQLGEILPEPKLAFNPEEIDLVAMLAVQCTVAIQHIRVYEGNQLARERLRLLYEASNALVSSLAPQDVLMNVIKRLRVAAKSDWARLILINDLGQPQQQIFEPLDAMGPDETFSLDNAIRPNGLSMQVMKRGRAIPIENTRTREPGEINPILQTGNIRAALCLPFSIHGKRIGIMWLHYSEPRPFAPSEIEDLQLYVNQAAIAYESARRLTTLEQVRLTAAELAKATNLPDVLASSASSACNVLQADSAAVFAYDAAKQLLTSQSVFSRDDSKALECLATEAGSPWHQLAPHVEIQGWMAIDNLDDPGGHPEDKALQTLSQHGLKSIQSSVLRVGDETLGILYVHYRGARLFDDIDRSTMTMFTHHAALALKQTKLLEQMRTTVKAAEETARTVASGKPSETLRAIARSTKRAVACDQVSLYVHDELRSHAGKVDQAATINCVTYDAEDYWQEEMMEANQVAALLAVERPYFTHTDDPRLRLPQGPQGPSMNACVVFPLRAAGQKVGVMLVGYQARRNIVTSEFEEMELFADQAAVGVHNALLIQQVAKRTSTLRALDTAGRVITSSLESDDILPRLAEQVWRLTHADSQAGGYADIWLRENDRASIVAAYPSEKLDTIRGLWPNGIDLHRPEEGRIGVVGRVMMTGESQLVTDIAEDPDYLRSHDEIQWALVEPIRIGQDIIGVINAEYPASEKFNEENQIALRTLAAQASIAIQNARNFAEIKRSRGIIGTRTAVAWMGMTSATWRHAIGNDATTIRDRVKLLQSHIASNLPLEDIEKHLHVIDQMARHIQDRPITAPLSNEGEVRSVDVNDVIRARLPRLQERYRHIHFVPHLVPDNSMSVRASEAWLKRACDYLIDNAIESMFGTSHKILTIATHRVGEHVEIVVDDTGHGMPEEVRSRVLQEPIPKLPGEKGSGVGLLIAQTIVQTYGGNIRLEKTNSNGTTMIISLPLEELPTQSEIKSGRRSFLFVCNRENYSSRRSINAALSSIGEVIPASENEAFGYALQAVFDLIIVDPVSVKSLESFIKNFLDRQEGEKIIVLTASPTWRTARKALQAGAYDYIDKSLPTKRLIEKFKDIMSENESLEIKNPKTREYYE